MKALAMCPKEEALGGGGGALEWLGVAVGSVVGGGAFLEIHMHFQKQTSKNKPR